MNDQMSILDKVNNLNEIHTGVMKMFLKAGIFEYRKDDNVIIAPNDKNREYLVFLPFIYPELVTNPGQKQKLFALAVRDIRDPDGLDYIGHVSFGPVPSISTMTEYSIRLGHTMQIQLNPYHSNSSDDIKKRIAAVGYEDSSFFNAQVNRLKNDGFDVVKVLNDQSAQPAISSSYATFIINPDKAVRTPDYVVTAIQLSEKLGKNVFWYNPIYRPQIIAICGSRKFKDLIMKEAERLSRMDKIVFTPNFIYSEDEFNSLTFRLKGAGTISKLEAINQVHYQKMKMADLIYVVNGGEGYLGDDTRREIYYAKLMGKPIQYYLKTYDNGTAVFAE